MSSLNAETVLSVHHWNDSLFSFLKRAAITAASEPL